ncbi:MAG: hypothetical protein M1826_002227 [Phylliscum demangeonii]|nr:MAG: hypothetical protein M1826_002227 [Phylliscum demangeonii]
MRLLDPRPQDCASLKSPDYANFGLSLFILLGILLSYLPQHHRIIYRRSSDGISPYFLLLGSTAGTSELANILLLSARELGCCRHGLTGFECFAGMLGVAQVGTQWLCFTTMYGPDHSTIAALYLLHLFLTLLSALFLLHTHPAFIPPLATAHGLLAALFTTLQYLPQLYTTFQRRAAGSLSIPMMLIQTPGAFVWAASLAARQGWAGWSTWGVLVVAGVLQGSLLGMAVGFEWSAWRERRAIRTRSGVGPHERTPLRLPQEPGGAS